MGWGAGADVRFDWTGSLDLARRLWQLAGDLDTLGVDRHRWAAEALAEWQGSFGVEFAGRIDDEVRDLGRAAAELRGAAEAWAHSWAAALNEQNRRIHARACEMVKSQRSTLDKIGGWFTGHDDLPPAPYERPVPLAPAFHATGSFALYRVLR